VVADPEIELFEGAERLWRFDVDSVVRRRAALGLRFQLIDRAKELHATGSWSGFRARRANESPRPPLPPFTRESAAKKVRLAEDAWNSRDPKRVALAYTEDSRWRNRDEFPVGRAEIEAFLSRKWQRELDYRLVKELWACEGHRIAVRFAYEWHDVAGRWFRSYGNENWEFAGNGLMRLRYASINDLPIAESDRLLRWPQGPRPDDHPGLSALGL
jgi:nuclear transport factor 2 (NTF2) superfamily protein